MRPFYFIIFGLAVLSFGLFVLLMQADVDYAVARYASGALFLIPTAIAGHFYLPAQNRFVLWAVLLGSALALVFRA